MAAIWVGGAGAARADDPWPDIRSDYREGNYASAISRLQKLVVASPKDREAHYYLALIYWRQENYVAAAQAYRRVLELDPGGPFGRDAQLWLTTYGDLAVVTSPRPTPMASPRPSPVTPPPSIIPTPATTPTPRPTTPVVRVTTRPSPRPVPSTRTPWLQAPFQDKGNRPRSANAKPGYFKSADGSFEFVPPTGFVLLDEGVEGSELRALFGPASTLNVTNGTEQPPTLLIVWREVGELKSFRADQRAARERQLLSIEAATYGPGAKLEARFGVPSMVVLQKQGGWAAQTWLFFQHERLYAVTYGGDGQLLPKFQGLVGRSLGTPIFYP